ncbi:glycosyltransferase family 15 protein Ecym_2558 [Eremothecium cymbalariae DBVPG|uniref:Glycosyltransferase family 15 protein n=1 Tax=Eremothecium cymbalariae (strain CBS 270.75 / DBVPG 7215 / KCTC 17166 / NRRL Y-17582) TaxID=931890 RepID=G8JQB9_ERECY|nr:Hypothetical protein Ecym_2558 [Eremothecium cymbalariae DBVPG\
MAVNISKRIIRLGLLSSFILLSVVFLSTHSKVNEFIFGSSVASDAVAKGITEGGEKPSIVDKNASKDLGDYAEHFAGDMESTGDSEGKPKACFVSLVRNEALWDIVPSIQQVEDRFNRNYKYPWVFLNDVPFTDEFKHVVSNIVSGSVEFGIIPKEHWSYPNWIDQEKAAKARQEMAENNIIYGGSEPYRHMCRFESGFFWRHPLLKKFNWYWRVEPSTQLYCDIKYDVFKWMQEHKKVYGFTISIREYEATIKTLWETTKQFMKEYPNYIEKDNMMAFISDDNGKTYNLCHFWSNFEIASLDFWRSDRYKTYFEYLDKAGGFFYERWGDAPVHSIAAALMLRKDQIHYFADIGYHHPPYSNCPADNKLWSEGRCSCNQKNDFTFEGYSCGTKFYEVNGMKRPT